MGGYRYLLRVDGEPDTTIELLEHPRVGEAMRIHGNRPVTVTAVYIDGADTVLHVEPE
jgi:hypothetical protein